MGGERDTADVSLSISGPDGCVLCLATGETRRRLYLRGSKSITAGVCVSSSPPQVVLPVYFTGGVTGPSPL